MRETKAKPIGLGATRFFPTNRFTGKGTRCRDRAGLFLGAVLLGGTRAVDKPGLVGGASAGAVCGLE